MFLNEILDEYYEQGSQECIDVFLTALWGSKYKFKKYKKYSSFNVDEKSLGYNQELIDLFSKYNNIPYYICKSKYKCDLESIDYIKIHINNTYAHLCDKDVYLKKEYYQQIFLPKREYFKTVKLIEKGQKVNIDDVKNKLEECVKSIDMLKQKSFGRKIKLTHKQFKNIINEFIPRIFDNYIPLSEFEKQHEYNTSVFIDGWNEDNYIISYFCKSITGYMRTYARQLQGVKRYKQYIECSVCGGLTEKKNNSQKYCSKCAREQELEKYKRYNKKRKQPPTENPQNT